MTEAKPAETEMVIFVRMYEFVSWLIPQSLNFPRAQRQVVTARLQNATLTLQELLIEANAVRGAQRAAKLRAADGELLKIKLYLRLSQRWAWLTAGQYHHASAMILEVGRLLGGWLKTVASVPSQPASPV